jgi:hypothetical protein
LISPTQKLARHSAIKPKLTAPIISSNFSRNIISLELKEIRIGVQGIRVLVAIRKFVLNIEDYFNATRENGLKLDIKEGNVSL